MPAEEIVKGYPYQPDQYVRLTEEELASLQPTDEKTIYLEHFLDPAIVDLVLFAGRTLYLAPANPAARRPFATVLQSLQRSGKWAVGRVVFLRQMAARRDSSGRRGAAGPHPLPSCPARALVNSEGGEVEISQQDLRPLLRLIDTTDGEIPWEDYQDDTERRLTELVEAKVTAAQNPRAGRANGRHARATAIQRACRIRPPRQGSQPAVARPPESAHISLFPKGGSP